MSNYEASIGLEIHAELNTQTKMYCSCRNMFGGAPNTRICPVCLGLPGALPVLNRAALEKAVKMGHALNCRINLTSHQDRKNYFYPDLPKSYQISQADVPVCENGLLEFMTPDGIKSVRITRIHIEEDAGKLFHDAETDNTLIDFNRCGVPLIEIVTEPDLKSSSDAHRFLDTIKNILLYIGISDCKMQEGSIRCDVNVSISEAGSNKLGTRCEMKNVNSFSAAARAIDYEIQRQSELLSAGIPVEQETRRWDDAKGVSILMRNKENASDYRYFPEPDLGDIILDEHNVNKLRESIPELPDSKVLRYTKEYGLTLQDAESIAADQSKAEYFDKCVASGKCSPKSIAKRILGIVTQHLNETGISINDILIKPEQLTDLITETENGTLSSSGEKSVYIQLAENGGELEDVINSSGLRQNSDNAYLETLANTVINQNPKAVHDYKDGKSNALGHLIGQAMKLSKGSADPARLSEIIKKMI